MEILRATPLYQRKAQLLAQGMRGAPPIAAPRRQSPRCRLHPRSFAVPGEMGNVRFDAPVRLLACGRNDGAEAVARELEAVVNAVDAAEFTVVVHNGAEALPAGNKRRVHRISGEESVHGMFMLPSRDVLRRRSRFGPSLGVSHMLGRRRKASEAVDLGERVGERGSDRTAPKDCGASFSENSGEGGGRVRCESSSTFRRQYATAHTCLADRPTHMLLYLNAKTFYDGGATAEMVRQALDKKVPIALVQEMNPVKQACAFRAFFESTPTDLLVERKLYDTLAVPWYPSGLHSSLEPTARPPARLPLEIPVVS